MQIDLRMKPVVQYVMGIAHDPDLSLAECIKLARMHFNLDDTEVQYLCRIFHVLTEDVR